MIYFQINIKLIYRITLYLKINIQKIICFESYNDFYEILNAVCYNDLNTINFFGLSRYLFSSKVPYLQFFKEGFYPRKKITILCIQHQLQLQPLLNTQSCFLHITVLIDHEYDV